MARFYRGHLTELDPTVPLSGTLTLIGKPQQVASLLATDLPGGAQTMTDASGSSVVDGAVAEGANVYLGGGYINGDSRSMPTAVPFGKRDDFDGFYAVAGIDAQVGDNAVLGFGFSYSKVDGTTGGVAQTARGELFQGTLYAKGAMSGFALDAQVSAGLYRAQTLRNVSLAGTPYSLRSQDNAFAFSSMLAGSDKSHWWTATPCCRRWASALSEMSAPMASMATRSRRASSTAPSPQPRSSTDSPGLTRAAIQSARARW